MGTGPVAFGEHVKGSHWVGRRNPEYWDRGKPYLDGYRALFIRDDAAQASAISSERAHIQFRGFSPSATGRNRADPRPEGHRAGEPVELRADRRHQPRQGDVP